MSNLEQELKLLLTAKEYETLQALTHKLPSVQTNFYFVAPDMFAETMVRIREKQNAYLLCYKNRLSLKDGVSVCDERECKLEANCAKKMIEQGIAAQEINSLLQTDFCDRLVCVGKMETYRTAFTLQNWHLELDKSVYLNRCDFELECECAEVEELELLKQYLVKHCGIALKYSKPKVQRFFEARMKYKFLIFDFDGTVNDTSEGIYHTFRKVLHLMGIESGNIDFSEHIGPPLEYSYTKLCGAERCAEGIALHQKVFAEDHAVEMSHLYDGIVETLQMLKNAGYVLAIASSKFQPHAIASIKNFGLDGIFTCVYGQNEQRGFKAEVLRQLIADNGWEKSKCLMIGDTFYDIDGAHQNGIDAMAVTYGFGKPEQLKLANAELTAHSPREIAKLLL